MRDAIDIAIVVIVALASFGSGRRTAVERERERIACWLHVMANAPHDADTDKELGKFGDNVMRNIADRILAGDHEKLAKFRRKK